MVSAAELPLPKLARHLAQKQSELAKARQAYEARLAGLTRRMQELQAQLRTVEAEMQAVGSLGSAKALPTPARASAAAATPAKPRMPAKTTSKPGRARTAPTLPGLVVDLVRAARRPLTVKELSE